MQVDRDLFMEQGFLILRDFIPRDKLDAIRASAEIMLERQKEIWRRERKPGDPPGGEWETAQQPRVMMELPGIIDEQTANVVEDFWIDDATLEVVGQLISGEPMIHSMMMLCSPPVEDHPGGTGWHRDFSALRTAPLAALQADLIENGPRYTQWNVPLYDDNVLWIVPGSHRRLNTPEEDAALRRSTKEPVPGGVAIELRAGDAAVYSHYLLHWGSNYTTRLRRTLHGGHVTLAEFDDLSFAEGLSRRIAGRPLSAGQGRARRCKRRPRRRCGRLLLGMLPPTMPGWRRWSRASGSRGRRCSPSSSARPPGRSRYCKIRRSRPTTWLAHSRGDPIP